MLAWHVLSADDLVVASFYPALQGYVDGFDGVLGHECVARVIECSARPELIGAVTPHWPTCLITHSRRIYCTLMLHHDLST